MTRRIRPQSPLRSPGDNANCGLKLKIVYRRSVELKPDPANPRRHSQKQVRQIRNSIEVFGFVVPILIDRDGNVVAGHGRLLAAKELGLTEVPTLCLDHLTPAQVRALRIADNRLTEIAVWDDRLLAEQFRDLSLLELDFSLELTGFEMPEIDLRIASLEDLSDADDDPADRLPDLPAGPPVSKIGDLWVLGRHRAVCANALDSACFPALLGDERAAAVFTDPPYNVPIDGHATGLGAIRHRPFPMASGEMDWRHLDEMLAAGRAAYSELKNLCVWAKDNGGMGSLYRSQHELVFVFKHGRASHRNNVQLGRFGRNRSNLWRYPGANSFARNSAEGNLLALHPTVKPVAMVADAILDCSARGEIILDPFLGSGTTVIAAERTGRRCCGIELDPAYVDTTIRRWQTLTGGNARHAASGRSFDDLARAAEATNGL
jgi:DNA modification methylase